MKDCKNKSMRILAIDDKERKVPFQVQRNSTKCCVSWPGFHMRMFHNLVVLQVVLAISPTYKTRAQYDLKGGPLEVIGDVEA